MAIARNFGPVAEQMAQALERYSKEELIDLLTHLVKTYVVEGTLPLKPEVGLRSDDEHLARLTFPQLVLHLQMRLDHREWSMFSVSGEDVWVTVGGHRVNLTGRPSALPAPPPPLEPVERTTAREPNPEPTPPVPPEPTREPASPEPEVPERPSPEPFSDDVEASERFGMLEID